MRMLFILFFNRHFQTISWKFLKYNIFIKTTKLIDDTLFLILILNKEFNI